MKRRNETFDLRFLHSEGLEAHVAIWVIGGYALAITPMTQKVPSVFLLS